MSCDRFAEAVPPPWPSRRSTPSSFQPQFATWYLSSLSWPMRISSWVATALPLSSARSRGFVLRYLLLLKSSTAPA